LQDSHPAAGEVKPAWRGPGRMIHYGLDGLPHVTASQADWPKMVILDWHPGASAGTGSQASCSSHSFQPNVFRIDLMGQVVDAFGRSGDVELLTFQ